MIELAFNELMVLIGVAQVPTWGLLTWMLKVQRTTCESVAKLKTVAAIYHKQPI